MVEDGRMFRKTRPHFPPFSLRLVLLSAAILVKIVTMSVIFSLLWPFRRSASAAEKFVAEIFKYEDMALTTSYGLMKSTRAVKLCMWFCVN